MFSKQPHIVVVGAGIVGASLAYHLVRQNARVTLLDKASKPPGGATDKSFGWITIAHDASETYIALRQQAMADWHRVEEELRGQLQIDWSGALTWHDGPAQTQRVAAKLTTAGYPVRLISQEQLRRLEPNLRHVPPQAILAEDEGAMDARLTTDMLITAARQAGAESQVGNEVVSLMTSGSRITGVVTTIGKMKADMVVLTAGVNTPTLCQPLDITLPMNGSRAILITFHTPHPFVNRIISDPVMDIRAASPTLTLCTADYIDESTGNNPQAIAQRSLEKIREHWLGAGSVNVANVTVGNRPIPENGLPIIGRAPGTEGLYVAVMHSGVTLAAVVGRLAASELVSDQDTVLLSPYRPTRFN